jgi:hypothetical protein
MIDANYDGAISGADPRSWQGVRLHERRLGLLDKLPV